MQGWLSKPGFLGTYATFGADLSFILALLFTLLFIWGWMLARKGQGNHHHIVTLWAMVAMIAYFAGYYLARNLGVLAVEGKEGFGGSEELYNDVFVPILTIHITVVALGLVMAIYMIILGFRAAVKNFSGNRVLKSSPLALTWGGAAKITIWSVAIFATIFFLIRLGKGEFKFTSGLAFIYLMGLVIVFSVLIIEKLIERIWPEGDRRHRILGRFTMTLFVIALVTSTATYVMLYILYPVTVGTSEYQTTMYLESLARISMR